MGKSLFINLIQKKKNSSTHTDVILAAFKYGALNCISIYQIYKFIHAYFKKHALFFLMAVNSVSFFKIGCVIFESES